MSSIPCCVCGSKSTLSVTGIGYEARFCEEHARVFLTAEDVDNIGQFIKERKAMASRRKIVEKAIRKSGSKGPAGKNPAKKKTSARKNPAARKNNSFQPPDHLDASRDDASQDDASRAINIGGARPQAAGMPTPLPALPPLFPADLLARLRLAAESGRYMIAVFTADEVGNIELFRNASGGYSYDWWLRSAALLRDDIAKADPPGMGTEAQAAGQQPDDIGPKETHPAADE